MYSRVLMKNLNLRLISVIVGEFLRLGSTPGRCAGRRLALFVICCLGNTETRREVRVRRRSETGAELGDGVSRSKEKARERGRMESRMIMRIEMRGI